MKIALSEKGINALIGFHWLCCILLVFFLNQISAIEYSSSLLFRLTVLVLLTSPIYFILTHFKQQIRLRQKESDQKESAIQVANNKVKEKQKELIFLADSLPACAAYINKEQQFIYSNNHLNQWFGLGSKNLKGQALNDILGKELSDKYQVLLEQVALTKETIFFDELNNADQHPSQYGKASFIPLLDQDQEVQGYLLYIEDITRLKKKEMAMRQINLKLETEAEERRKAVQALEESELRYRTLFENNSLGVLTTDQHMRITKVNRAFCQLLTYSEADLNTMSICDISIDKKLERYEVLMQKMVNHELPTFNIEHTLISQYGEPIDVLVSVTALYNQEGKFHEAVAVINNITEKKKAQEKLLIVNQELQQFASVASHDMKEPLRTISSFSELLARRINDDDPSKQEFLHFIRDAAKRMTTLLEDLITYARAGIENQEKKTIDLNDILLSVQNNLYSKIENTQSQISQEKLPTVYGHFTPFTQLFQNIIANSIKFQKKGTKPKIHIDGVMLKDEYLIQISDNGIGMDKESAQKIFDPFRRLHSRAEYEGSGIGLATCKKIVEQYNGQIWVDSELGKGTTFFISLPLKMICTPVLNKATVV